MGKTFVYGGETYELPSTDDNLKAKPKTFNYGGVDYELPETVQPTVEAAPAVPVAAKPKTINYGGVDYELPKDNLVEANKVEERGFGERFGQSLTDSMNYGFVGNPSRWINDYVNTGKDQLKRQFPGKDEAWYEQKHDESIVALQKQLREEAETRQANDPNWRPDESFLEATIKGRWVPWFLVRPLALPILRLLSAVLRLKVLSE